jgi:uncharacterized protein YcfJ
VVAAVAGLAATDVVISGGCRGVDRWAVEAAKARGLATEEIRPELGGVRCRGEAARRYHDRNQAVVDAADSIIAFPAPCRTGGTEDTIRRAEQAGKPVRLL